MDYWERLGTFWDSLASGLGYMWSFLVSNSLTFTALAIGILALALDILFSLGDDDKED